MRTQGRGGLAEGLGAPGRLDDEETVARAATRYVPRNFSGGSQPDGRVLGENRRGVVLCSAWL